MVLGDRVRFAVWILSGSFIFTTKSIETINYCQEYFGFALPSVLRAKRISEFESGFNF